MNPIVTACFFISGMAGLALEVLWTKMLTLVFGSTTLAVSTTVAAFMGGLSLGAALAPKISARFKNPLCCYAALEAAIGLYALAVPHILRLMPSLQSALWPVMTPHPVVYSLARFAVTFIVLLIPTTAMGATLPILSAYFVSGPEESGVKAGCLYAVNTAGALGGTMAAGFLAIPALGVRGTNFAAAAADIAVACAMLIASKGCAAGPRLHPEEPVKYGIDGKRPESGSRAFLYAVAAAAGFAAMALQMLWTRSLSVIIGSSTYSFTIILSAFLAGISIGAAAYARALPKRRDTAGDLSLILAWIGLSALLCSLYIDRLPFVLQALLETESLTMARLHLFNFIIAWLVVFLPTLGMGAFFPLSIHMVTEDVASLERSVGRIYSFSTAGNILGAALTAFLIIPAFGISRGLTAVTAAYLLLSAAVALAFRSGERLKARTVQAGAAAAAAFLILFFTPAWDIARWSVGMFRIYLARGVYSKYPFRPPKMLYCRDGMVTTVTVEGRDTGISLKVNGKVDASNGTDMHTQILSGMWPMLLHENPKDALMVGYGSGVTAGAILRFPLERFTVVELESAVFEAARFFDEYNHRPWSDPRMRMVVDDGRNHLAADAGTYDVIVSEPSNPWVSGASNLFTREFWEIARARLRPGGIFAQWLQLYELSQDNIKALINTYSAVFPHVFILHARTGSNDTLMIGSNQPIKLDWPRLSEVMSRPGIREEFERAEAKNPHDLLALLLLDESSVPAAVKGAAINTDDNSLIEFSAPGDLLAYAMQDADMPPPKTVEGRLVDAVEPMVIGRPTGAGEREWLCELSRALTRKGRYEEAGRTARRAEKIEGGPKPSGGCDPVLAIKTLGYLQEKERIFPFDTAGREGAGDRWGYLVQLLSADNYRAAYSFLSPPDTGETVTERVPGASISYPKPGFTKNTALDFLRGYLLYLMNSSVEALHIWDTLSRDPDSTAKQPMINYFIARARLQAGEYLPAMEAMERYAAAAEPAAN